MITNTAISLPQPVPPNIALIAVENGAFAVFNAAFGTMPNTAVNDSM